MKEPNAQLRVRVQPRSSQSKVEVQPDGSIRVWTTAPPVDGQANDAVEKVIAEKLGVAKSRVLVTKGHTGRTKTLTVEGLTEAECVALLFR